MGMTVFENGDGDGDRICRGKVSSRRAVVTRAWKYDIAGGRWSLAMCCASLASIFDCICEIAARTQQVIVLLPYYVNFFKLHFSLSSSQCPCLFNISAPAPALYLSITITKPLIKIHIISPTRIPSILTTSPTRPCFRFVCACLTHSMQRAGKSCL